MERLTNWIDSQRSALSEPTPVDFCNQCVDKKCLACSFQCAINRLAAYENTGYTPEEVQAIKDAEEQGLLVRLPCKVGHGVYQLDYYYDCAEGKYDSCDLFAYDESSCERCAGNKIVKIIREVGFDLVMLSDFGKTVFLTREEAEKALEEVNR